MCYSIVNVKPFSFTCKCNAFRHVSHAHLVVQCSVPKLSEVLSRVEGEQLGAACKVLAVTITDMDTYHIERGDDLEFKLARDSNKVTTLTLVVCSCWVTRMRSSDIVWRIMRKACSHIRSFSEVDQYYRLSGAAAIRAQFLGEAPDIHVRPPEHEPDDFLGRLLGQCDHGGAREARGSVSPRRR